MIGKSTRASLRACGICLGTQICIGNIYWIYVSGVYIGYIYWVYILGIWVYILGIYIGCIYWVYVSGVCIEHIYWVYILDTCSHIFDDRVREGGLGCRCCKCVREATGGLGVCSLRIFA